MKKKLSMLAALALCTTIGGVYAAWIYSTDNVPSGYGVSNLAIAGVDYEGNAGSISVVGTNTEIKIDDLGVRDHITEMDYNEDGYFTVTFTPSATATESIKDGMNIEWYVGLSDGKAPLALDDYQYTFDGASTNIISNIIEDEVLVKIADMQEVDGSYTFMIDMDDVVGKISLSAIKLDSKDKYDAYLTALKNGFIHVHAEVVENT